MGAMPRPERFALIDTSSERSLSFAPPDRSTSGGHQVSAGHRPPHAVGPGPASIATSALLGTGTHDGVSGYPIQLGKVRRPPLRDETLARHRLLDWLDRRIQSRVIFVVAEAGYGKTTLLADFSRKTRQRTLWYRMDAEDRNWVAFLSYLVASGRVHDPTFAPRTRPSSPTLRAASREEVVETFVEELPTIAHDGAILILDDFHMADEVPEIRSIARELVARAPERLTLIFSTRRHRLFPSRA